MLWMTATDSEYLSLYYRSQKWKPQTKALGRLREFASEENIRIGGDMN